MWEKVEKLLNIDFESKPVYGDDDKYIKTKTKIYADIIVRNFHNKEMLKEKSPCKGLSVIIIDSVIKSNKKYYPQTLLEECKYVQEKNKNTIYLLLYTIKIIILFVIVLRLFCFTIIFLVFF